MKTSKLFKRMAMFLAVTVLFTAFAQSFLPRNAGAETGVGTHPSSGSKRTSIGLGTNTRFELQFSVSKPVRQVGIVVAANSTGKKLLVSLYRWDRDPRTTRKTEPLYREELDSWERDDLIGYTSEEGLPAGEYMLEVMAIQGGGVRINWYAPGVTGFQGYRDDIFYEGAPDGRIVFMDGSADGLLPVTPSLELPENAAPPESEISPDSEIARRNVDSTSWHYVDGLGRTGTDYARAGDKNSKKIGIFYWTWHNFNAAGKPQSLEYIIREYPEASHSYNHPAWTEYRGTYYWNEPLFGYYVETDDYVLRKHAELLADANIDFVAFDCTNDNLTFENEYLNLLKVWSQARADGVKTPQICFMLPFGDTKATVSSLEQIYCCIYRDGRYQDLWFYWEGKPLVIGLKRALNLEDPLEKEIAQFFTFREGEPSYWLEDQTDDTWGWLHVYPQAVYRNPDGTVEMTTVGVSQNADYEKRILTAMNYGKVMGRSYSEQKDFCYKYNYRGREIVANSSMENSKLYGINFQEQWDYAIAQDPELIFVTGWNEYYVCRFEKWSDFPNAFPDQFTDEYSRDVEPTKGDLKDYYYYQLVDNVRRFKGMSAPEYQPLKKTIDVQGSTGQWTDEGLLNFTSYPRNTYERNAVGIGKTVYENPGIRNDFVNAKVSYDDEFIYFYVETDQDITDYTDENWMRLLLDTGEATADSTDWENFEFIVGRETGSDRMLTLEHSTGGWNWEKVSDVEYSVQGRVMQLKIAKADLGITGDDFTFCFKWADANLTEGDVMTLYTDGDTAPGGRFTYVFRAGEAPESDKPNKNRKGCGGILAGETVFLCLVPFAAAALLRKKSDD